MKTCTHKNTYKNTHSNIIYNKNIWKPIVAYLYKGTWLLSNKNKWITDIDNNMDEISKTSCQVKEAIPKQKTKILSILCVFIHMTL